MLDVIICANFGSEKLRGLGYTGGIKFWFFPLKWLVTLTTVLPATWIKFGTALQINDLV